MWGQAPRRNRSLRASNSTYFCHVSVLAHMGTAVRSVRSAVALPRSALYDDTEPLSSRLRVAVLASILPIALTSALIAGYVGVRGPDVEVSRAVVDTAYGVAALAVLGGVYLALDAREWRATLSFEVPGRTELAWTVVSFPLAVGGFLLGSTVGELFGFSMSGVGYSLSDPVTLAAVVFGGIVVAPLVEEILFRGLLLGSLLGRGLSPAAAGATTVILFAAVHLISLGPAGVLAIAGWAIFPTALRLKFNNLTGAWLLHLANNVYSYVVLVALGVV